MHGLILVFPLFQFILPVSLKNAFRQVLKSEMGIQGEKIHKAFFTCDREISCTHVVVFEESGKSLTLNSEDDLNKINGKFNLWEKVTVDDACKSSPCRNGGTCNADAGGRFHCDCSRGYEGAICEQDIDECASSPCKNGGSCNEYIGFYNCTCSSGWTGTSCANVDECASNPCKFGGECIDGINQFTCNCKLDYSGNECQLAPPGYTFGDGSGGTEEFVADVATREECINLCKARVKNGSPANAITLDAATQKRCYCEYGQTGISSSFSWINKYI